MAPIDFKNFSDNFYKFTKDIFDGSDEKTKLELVKGMQTLMIQHKHPILIKRQMVVPRIDFEAEKIKSTASKLPNEMWLKIMSYLKNKDIFKSFALVNKHFHALTLDPSTVKYLELEDIRRDKTKSKVLYGKWIEIIKQSRSLVKLKIKDHNECLDWNGLIKETLKSSQHLKHLILDCNDIWYNGKYFMSTYVPESLKLANLWCRFGEKWEKGNDIV